MPQASCCSRWGNRSRGTASGSWPGRRRLSARAPPRCSRREPGTARRVVPRTARAGRCRAGGLRPARSTDRSATGSTRPWTRSSSPWFYQRALLADAARRGAPPHTMAIGGGIVGPGPGTGSQDDPPQDRRARRRQGKAADLQMAIAGRRAAASPDDLAFMYIDGHLARAWAPREIQKIHVARLKRPRPGHRGRPGSPTEQQTSCWSSWPSRRPRWPRRSRNCCPASAR